MEEERGRRLKPGDAVYMGGREFKVREVDTRRNKTLAGERPMTWVTLSPDPDAQPGGHAWYAVTELD